MRYSLDKYRYISYFNKERNAKEIVAISTYAGKTVKGIASCHPGDNFDEQKGKELAAARCNLKISERRMKRAMAQRNKALAALEAAQKHYNDMECYANDSISEVTDAKTHLKEVLANF